MKKKLPGDTIILHKYTENHDHMLHCSGDTRCDGCDFYFSVWAIFVLLLPKQPEKSKFKKMKKTPGDIIVLHMCTKNNDHMMYSC